VRINASQLQAPPGAFHRNRPSRARLVAHLGGSVGLKLAVLQLNHSQKLRKMVLCFFCLHSCRQNSRASAIVAIPRVICETYFAPRQTYFALMIETGIGVGKTTDGEQGAGLPVPGGQGEALRGEPARPGYSGGAAAHVVVRCPLRRGHAWTRSVRGSS